MLIPWRDPGAHVVATLGCRSFGWHCAGERTFRQRATRALGVSLTVAVRLSADVARRRTAFHCCAWSRVAARIPARPVRV